MVRFFVGVEGVRILRNKLKSGGFQIQDKGSLKGQEGMEFNYLGVFR